MIIHLSIKLGGRRYYGSEDTIILGVEENVFTCSQFNPSLLFIYKRHRLNAHRISS